LINTPAVFPLLWKVGKAFFDPEVIKKFSIHSDNGFGVLSQIIQEEEIPLFAGGPKRGIALGGKGYNWGGTQKASISKSAKFKQEIIIDEEATVISWNFKTDKDVDFYLEYNGDRVNEYGRIRQHKGKHVTDAVGTYHLVFDNTASKSKITLHFKYRPIAVKEESE